MSLAKSRRGDSGRTWSDYLQLRKSGKPEPGHHDADVRVYADTSGALRSIQSDGTDAAIGAGGPNLIGPYAIAFNLPGLITTGLNLATFATPTLIIRAFAISRVDWETAGSGPSLQLLADNAVSLVIYDPKIPNVGREMEFFWTAFPYAQLPRVVEASASLDVAADPDAPAFSAGQADVYALVAPA